MDPISPGAGESATAFASLSQVVPFLTPVSRIITFIVETIDDVADNKNQCYYLLKRCTDLCLHVNQLFVRNKVVDHLLGPLEELKR